MGASLHAHKPLTTICTLYHYVHDTSTYTAATHTQQETRSRGESYRYSDMMIGRYYNIERKKVEVKMKRNRNRC